MKTLADLKVVALLTGLQTDFTKCCCFLCEWDSRVRNKHYIMPNWPHRETFILSQEKVVYDLLIRKENIFFPPLHIKLGLIKQFVKPMDKPGGELNLKKNKFSRQ